MDYCYNFRVYYIYYGTEGKNRRNLSGSYSFYFSMLFEVIGISFLVTGIKQIKRDKKTNEFGIITYGQIISTCKTGASSNGRKELQAEILTYIPDTNSINRINEIMGFRPTGYNVGDFVQLKYCEGDVNIIQTVSENMIPSSILTLLKEATKKQNIVIINR